MSKILATFHKEFSLHLDDQEQKEVRRLVNLELTGKENCNKLVKGKYVAANSPSVDEKLKNIHWKIAKHQRFLVYFDVTSKGNFINFRIIEQYR